MVVHGAEVDTLRRRRLPRFRRSVGLVFQDFKLLPALTVRENVAFALRVMGKPRRAVERRAAEALETVGLAGMDRKYPCELSGGEQQRVAIARALIHRPRLIVRDERAGTYHVDLAAPAVRAPIAPGRTSGATPP